MSAHRSPALIDRNLSGLRDLRSRIAGLGPAGRKSGAVLIPNVTPPSWRPDAGWKPALQLKLGQQPKSMAEAKAESPVRAEGGAVIENR